MSQFLRFSFFLIVLLPASVFGQTMTKQGYPSSVVTTPPAAQQAANTDNTNVVEPYDGTYRFIFTKGVKQAFTDEIIKVIEQNRKENEEVTLVLSEYCKLQLLSRRQIAAPGFIPFAQSFIFE